jgi:hypothetical protein
MDIVNKLFNTSANEEVIKSLVGELHIPKANMPKFLSNMSNFASSLTPVVAGGNSYQLYFNIENMTGTKKDADNLAKTMVTKLKSIGAV